MKRLKIRARMTILNAAAASLLFTAAFAVIYLLTSHIIFSYRRQSVELALSQVMVQVENRNGSPYYEDEVPLSADARYAVWLKDGDMLSTSGGALPELAEVEPKTPVRVQIGDSAYLAMTSGAFRVGDEDVCAMTAVSCEGDERMLALLRLIFLLALPLLLACSCIISFIIAGRILAPIHTISETAERLAHGRDFSLRISEIGTHDELDALIQTLNRMLGSLEDAFRRERRFTSDASHELRTPLAVMTSYAENLMKYSSPTPMQQEGLSVILKECGQMNHLIAQMLSLARAQTGRLPFRPETLSVRDVVDGVAAALNDRLCEKHIALSCEVDEAFCITADQSLFTQLMLNLVENAVKYGRDGGHIVVTTERRQNMARIAVRDDGIGISETDLPHVFERFYRVDTVRDRSGTGLGLSLCSEIAALHGGSLHVTSKLGEGSEFVVELPKH